MPAAAIRHHRRNLSTGGVLVHSLGILLFLFRCVTEEEEENKKIEGEKRLLAGGCESYRLRASDDPYDSPIYADLRVDGDCADLHVSAI